MYGDYGRRGEDDPGSPFLRGPDEPSGMFGFAELLFLFFLFLLLGTAIQIKSTIVISSEPNPELVGNAWTEDVPGSDTADTATNACEEDLE